MIFVNNEYQLKRIYINIFLMVTLITQLTSCAFAPWEKPIDKNKTPEAQLEEVKKEVINSLVRFAQESKLICQIECVIGWPTKVTINIDGTNNPRW
jgi:hypothetical protein